MENNNVNNLIEEGKKHLSALQAELEKLATTAEQIAGVKVEEVSKQAEILINETKTQIEAKTKELRETEEFKNLETEGKKALAEAEVKINELAAQFDTVAQDVAGKLKNLFGK